MMNGCLNVLWHFPFLGFLFAFFYALWGALLCCTVVLYPVGLGYFQIARFLLSPFTSALVTRKELDLVRPKERSTAAMAYSTLITVLYIPFGLLAAAGAVMVIAGEFLSIIGIPCGIVWFKALRAIFSPIDMVCVPKAVGDEIERIKAGAAVSRFKGEEPAATTPPAAASPQPRAEFDTTTLPPRPEVRSYDDERLREILDNPELYQAALVGECRRELEIRSQSAALMPKVEEYDDAKLREILANPQMYSDQIIYCCQRVMDERRRLWEEQQAREEERRRLERERQAEEARIRRIQTWKKWRPYVCTGIVLLVLLGAGTGYYFHHREQVRLKQERIAWAKRMEEQRILEQKRLEAERKQAEAERLAAERQAAERKRRIAEQKKADEERRKAGKYKVGEIYEKDGIRGVVFETDETGLHGKVVVMGTGMDSWASANRAGMLPSVEEMKAIFAQKKLIDPALRRLHAEPLGAHGYWLSRWERGIVWYWEYGGVHNCTECDVRSKPYKKWTLWVVRY